MSFNVELRNPGTTFNVVLSTGAPAGPKIFGWDGAGWWPIYTWSGAAWLPVKSWDGTNWI